jgi:hypothetical protein
MFLTVGVAQLVRAPGCGPGGRGFETHHSPHLRRLTIEYYDLREWRNWQTRWV